MANVSYLQTNDVLRDDSICLINFVSIVISHAVSLFNHARCYIIPHLLLPLGKFGFRGKTNDGVNFQLVGVSSNFAENVRFNPCPLEPSDTRAIQRNDARSTAKVRCPKAAEAAPRHARTRPARESMVFDREHEPACHEGRTQLAKTQSFGDPRGRSHDRAGRTT